MCGKLKKGPKRKKAPESAPFFSFPLRDRVDILPAMNGEDSYGVAMIDSHGRFGGFLLHRPALLRRISTGFTLGLSSPRSVFQDAESL